MKKMDGRIYIGSYPMGCQCVDVWVNPADGGGACCSDGVPWGDLSVRGRGPCSIEVGLRRDWDDTLGIFLHEAYELYSLLCNHRLDGPPSYSGGFDKHVFIMTHDEMSECFAAIGMLSCGALPALSKAYNKYHKEPK